MGMNATTPPASLRTSISPPPARIRATEASSRSTPQRKSAGPAALEAGLTSILPDQQLQYWSTLLSKHIDPSPTSPLLPIPAFRNLYTRNAAPGPRACHRSSGGPPPHAPSHHNGGGGKHFVIHQHDHPIAGLHYDLRLQINGTSSVSWAIMYGLPGDPNSKAGLNRNATETRVHCLWVGESFPTSQCGKGGLGVMQSNRSPKGKNGKVVWARVGRLLADDSPLSPKQNHLIETASASTGSMLIWDTGEYEVLPHHSNTAREPETSSDGDDDNKGIDDDNESEETLSPSDNPRQCSSCSAPSEQEKLHQSFQHRKLRLRLHGTRLPPNYTITLRLSSSAPDFPPPPSRKRKRKAATDTVLETPQTTPPPPTTSLFDSDDGDDEHDVTIPDPKKPQRKISEDDKTRCTNAYPGATNSINSVHQRTWYLSLDRAGCGFVRVGHDEDGRPQQRRTTQWVRARSSSRRKGDGGGRGGGFEPFYVLGRDVERSVVTGRTAGQVMRDEGVEGFVGRRGWKGKV